MQSDCKAFYGELAQAVQKSGKTWNAIGRELDINLAGYAMGNRADSQRSLKMPGLDKAIAIADYFGLSLDSMCHRTNTIKDTNNLTFREAITVLDGLDPSEKFCSLLCENNNIYVRLPPCSLLGNYLAERKEIIDSISQLDFFSDDKRQKLLADAIDELDCKYEAYYNQSGSLCHAEEDPSPWPDDFSEGEDSN